MRARHLVLLPLLLIAACAPAHDKYPYPPQYLSAADVPPQTIPAPPRPGSAEYKKEVDSIVATQRSLTKKQVADIHQQIDITPDKIVQPVIGSTYSEDRYPLLYGLLKRVASDSWRIGDEARDYWKSPRPWYTEPRVTLLTEPIKSYGYPSGHTTTYGSWAYVLADLFPAKRDTLFERAWGVAQNRVKGGAHYPHDIEGGKKMATAIYAKLKDNPAYQHDLAEVREELQRKRQLVQLCPENLSGCYDHARPAPTYMSH